MGCAGIMHTDVKGIIHMDALGDVPIGPARNYGDMGMLTVQGDTYTPPALGNMYASVTVGQRRGR